MYGITATPSNPKTFSRDVVFLLLIRMNAAATTVNIHEPSHVRVHIQYIRQYGRVCSIYTRICLYAPFVSLTMMAAIAFWIAIVAVRAFCVYVRRASMSCLCVHVDIVNVWCVQLCLLFQFQQNPPASHPPTQAAFTVPSTLSCKRTASHFDQ